MPIAVLEGTRVERPLDPAPGCVDRRAVVVEDQRLSARRGFAPERVSPPTSRRSPLIGESDTVSSDDIGYLRMKA